MASAARVTNCSTATANAQVRNQLFIGGEWVNAGRGATLPIVCPATEKQYAMVGRANEGDVDKAVAAAREAFDNGPWRQTTGTQRAGYLRAIARAVTDRLDSLALAEAVNNGKPLPEAAWDVEDVAGCFEYYADLAEGLDARQGTVVDVPMEEFRATLRYEPAGVAACILPFNYPLLMAAWKVAPALAAGCTVIVKPSELTPVTALELADICDSVGLPPGVVNIITGDSEAGAPLAAHTGIDKLAFTGSVPTGIKVMQSATPNVVKTTLELGGKSPIVVFDDVDIGKAVEWIMFGVFWTNGQICSSTSRLLVHEAVAEPLLAALVEETSKITAGDPLADGVKLGPLVSHGQMLKVLGHIETAVAAGAKVLAGGGRVADTPGFFVEPTVLAVEPSNPIWTTEVFGPVLSVVTFSSEEEALELSNDSQFGLAAAVLSDDGDRCARFANSFRSGIVWVNCSQPCFVQLPWGGLKKSGVGRELGEFGLNNFLEVKQVLEYVSDQPWGWYKPNPRL